MLKHENHGILLYFMSVGFPTVIKNCKSKFKSIRFYKLVMINTRKMPQVKVKRTIFDIMELLRSEGFFDLIMKNKEKGYITIMTHLKIEYERTRDERLRQTYDWISKHKDEFFWGITDGFIIG